MSFHLQPVARRAGAVGGLYALRHDALEAHSLTRRRSASGSASDILDAVMQNAEFSYRHMDEHGNYNWNLVWEDASGQKFIVGVAEKPDKKGVYEVRTSFDTTEEKFARQFLEAIELRGGINAVKIVEDHAAVGRVLRATRRAWAQARQQVRNPQLQSFIAGSLTILQTSPPNAGAAPRQRAGDLPGSSACAGAAMAWASPAASEALALTTMSRPCLCSARLSP